MEGGDGASACSAEDQQTRGKEAEEREAENEQGNEEVRSRMIERLIALGTDAQVCKWDMRSDYPASCSRNGLYRRAGIDRIRSVISLACAGDDSWPDV